MRFRDSRSFEWRAVGAKNSASRRRFAFRKCRYIETRWRIRRFRRRVHESSSARVWIDPARTRTNVENRLAEKSVRSTWEKKGPPHDTLDSIRLRSTPSRLAQMRLGLARIIRRIIGITSAILQRTKKLRREVGAVTSYRSYELKLCRVPPNL